MICIGIAVAQMILSAILGLIHGGVLGYFVAGINVVSILMFMMGFGYYLRGEAIKKENAKYSYANRMDKNKAKENGKHEPELD